MIEKRILAVIEYRTAGRKSEFAAMMGWSRQRLSKILRGEGIGLNTAVRILEVLPEIDARWLLMGAGEMLSDGYRAELSRRAADMLCDALDLGRCLRHMTPEEVSAYRDAIDGGGMPGFTRERMDELRRLADADADAVRDAINRSGYGPCRQRTVCG